MSPKKTFEFVIVKFEARRSNRKVFLDLQVPFFQEFCFLKVCSLCCQAPLFQIFLQGFESGYRFIEFIIDLCFFSRRWSRELVFCLYDKIDMHK